MNRARVIPVLLLHKGGVYKSKGFKNYSYVGDPINAVKLFNDKEADEIIILDIDSTKDKRAPDIRRIGEIAGEAFMPVSYGGGITNTEEVRQLFYQGIEKVILNYSAFENPKLISEIANKFGSSSIVVSIDYKKDWLGKDRIFTLNGKKKIEGSPVDLARHVESLGAGEIMLNSIDKDGTYKGYDIEMIEKVSHVLSIPLIACGGASSVGDFKKAINAGASAVAAGSMFVFQRPHNAVLISYPNQDILTKELYT